MHDNKDYSTPIAISMLVAFLALAFSLLAIVVAHVGVEDKKNFAFSLECYPFKEGHKYLNGDCFTESHALFYIVNGKMVRIKTWYKDEKDGTVKYYISPGVFYDTEGNLYKKHQ